MLEAVSLVLIVVANIIFFAFLYAFWAIVSEVIGGCGDLWRRARRVQFTLPSLFAVVTICGVTFGLLRMVHVQGWAANSLLLILSLLWSLALVFGAQAIYEDVFRRRNNRAGNLTSPPPPDFSSLARDALEPGRQAEVMEEASFPVDATSSY